MNYFNPDDDEADEGAEEEGGLWSYLSGLFSEPFATKNPATHSRFSADQPPSAYRIYRLLWLGGARRRSPSINSLADEKKRPPKSCFGVPRIDRVCDP
mgnify:CR=1 FL=1